MHVSLPSIEKIMTLLAEAPSQIAATTADLKSVQLHTSLGHEEWSANDVLAHLRSCADVWGNCIVTIIAQDNPTIRAINPRTWIKQTNYLEQKFQSSLHAFAIQRTDLLNALEPLTHADWLRSAIVTGAGKPLERTVLFYAQWMASHERPHLKQIKSIANTMRLQ